MNKVLTVLFVLISIVIPSLHAQVDVNPHLVDGSKVRYTSRTTITRGDSIQIYTHRTIYAVSNVTTQGAVINVVQQESDPKDDLNEIPVSFSTDSQGRLLCVLNADEIKEKVKEYIHRGLQHYEDENIKRVVEEETEKLYTAENILMQHKSNGVLALNGMTVSDGMIDNFFYNGLKLKRTYSVTGKTITAKTTLDMTQEEIKNHFRKQLGDSIPNMEEMFEQAAKEVPVEELKVIKKEYEEKIEDTLEKAIPMIDMTSVYELDDEGWVKSIHTESIEMDHGRERHTTTLTSRL